MAKFEKGNAGRPVGSTNKTTNVIREKVLAFLDKNIDQIQDDFKSIKNPEDRLDFVSKLLPYAVPKLQNTQITQEGDIHIKVTHES